MTAYTLTAAAAVPAAVTSDSTSAAAAAAEVLIMLVDNPRSSIISRQDMARQGSELWCPSSLAQFPRLGRLYSELGLRHGYCQPLKLEAFSRQQSQSSRRTALVVLAT
jgi:hypothetical protein